ncbi:MAG: CHRD domain-containing protein [Chloroflexota bacterium]
MKQRFNGLTRLLIGIAIGVTLGTLPTTVTTQDHGHGDHDGEPRPELTRESSVPLNVGAGSDIGLVFQAFPSPQQEGGEEEDTPRFIPDAFRSTTPSIPREERTSRGHAVLEFTNDLSRAYLHVQIENVDVDEINMFHLHCGRPGQLGPILVDFGMMGDLQDYFADGMLSIEITNADLEWVIDNSQGLVGAFTGGCPIHPSIPTERITTIGGMAYVAGQGELYFNLHTTGQTYFGDIRGAFFPVDTSQ